MARLLTILFLVFISHISKGQYKLSITIDDVPNTDKYYKDKQESLLLNKLDSLSIPVAIFINEGLLYKTGNVSENINLLKKWFSKNFVTIGNHTYKHSRYSEVGIDSFIVDITKGESISQELSKTYNKTLEFFRFPYNDLGKDSLQQLQIKNFLSKNNYTITPFTIESSDWMFNYIYEYHLKNNNEEEARKTANLYISKTLEYFDFFDSVSLTQYNRHIHHIYLCHDNSINADCIDILINKLKKKEFNL